METRKLQEVGGGTYTVSVPREWARGHRLDAGSELHLYTHLDGSLVVRVSRKDGGDLASTRITVDGRDPAAAERALRAAHAAGFDATTLVARESFADEGIRAVRSAVRNPVGMEIVDESDVSIRQSLVQLQFVALSAHREATAALVDGDGDGGALERRRRHGDEAGRLCGMISRHFNRSLTSFEEVDRLGITRPTLFDYHATAGQLEGVAVRAVGVARAAERPTEPLPDGIAEDVRVAADAAGKAVEEATAAVLARSGVDAAHAALDGRDEALAGIEAIDRGLIDGAPSDGSTAGMYVLGGALRDLARTAEHGGAIAEVAMRAATRDEDR